MDNGTSFNNMATPEQIAYRRILERKAAAAEKRRFENRCKYILGGILAKQLRVSSWGGLEEVRESLKESNNLDKIEWYLKMKGVGMADNDSVPKIKKSESFDRWLASEIKKVEVEELTKKIKAYLFRNRERIKLGLSRKILTFKTLAEKLSVELGCRVTAKKVQTVWYQLLREEKKRTAEDTPDPNNQRQNFENSAQEQNTKDLDTLSPESKYQGQ